MGTIVDTFKRIMLRGMIRFSGLCHMGRSIITARPIVQHYVSTIPSPALNSNMKRNMSLMPSTHLLNLDNVQVESSRTYKVGKVLRKRCPKCYFQRRENRLYVECDAKPRHKQMQRMSKKSLIREEPWFDHRRKNRTFWFMHPQNNE